MVFIRIDNTIINLDKVNEMHIDTSVDYDGLKKYTLIIHLDNSTCYFDINHTSILSDMEDIIKENDEEIVTHFSSNDYEQKY